MPSAISNANGNALEDGLQLHVRRDAVDDEQIVPHRAADQADLHVDGENHREPVRDRNPTAPTSG